MSKKQFVVSLSSIESEYIAASHASKEVVWLQRLCTKIGFEQQVVRLDCDSWSAIFLAKNPSYHSKKKVYWCTISFREGDGRKWKSLARKSQHSREHCIIANQVDEYKKFHLVKKWNGPHRPVKLNGDFSVSWNLQRKQQVGECWGVIFFAELV